MLIELFEAWSSVWYSLSPFSRFFLLLFVLVRLRSLRTVQNDNSHRKSLALLNHRSANLRQTVVAMFYIFGLTFFLQIPNAFQTQGTAVPLV